MSETEERMLALCETVACALESTARLGMEVTEILQSALGLREGLRAPDEMTAPANFLDGSPVGKGL